MDLSLICFMKVAPTKCNTFIDFHRQNIDLSCPRIRPSVSTYCKKSTCLRKCEKQNRNKTNLTCTPRNGLSTWLKWVWHQKIRQNSQHKSTIQWSRLKTGIDSKMSLVVLQLALRTKQSNLHFIFYGNIHSCPIQCLSWCERI